MEVNKALELQRLTAELVAAGVAVPRGLGSQGGPLETSAAKALFTWDGGGLRVDLPAGAAAVIAAHIYQPPATPFDAPASSLAAIRADLEAARAELAAARTLIINTDTGVQGLGASPTAGALRSAVTGVSTALHSFALAQISADQFIADALGKVHDAIAALKARG